jgi:hypothetical protein
MNDSTSWPSTSQQGLFSSYSSHTHHLGELVLVLILPMYYQKLIFDDYELSTTYSWSQPRCWVPCTPLFFLVLRGIVKRSLWDPLLRVVRLPFDHAVLCGLVPTCGSVVVRRSSRSLRGFGASLPVASSHSTFVRYKTFICFLQQVILLRNLLPLRLGHPKDLSCNILNHKGTTTVKLTQPMAADEVPMTWEAQEHEFARGKVMNPESWTKSNVNLATSPCGTPGSNRGWQPVLYVDSPIILICNTRKKQTRTQPL